MDEKGFTARVCCAVRYQHVGLHMAATLRVDEGEFEIGGDDRGAGWETILLGLVEGHSGGWDVRAV